MLFLLLLFFVFQLIIPESSRVMLSPTKVEIKLRKDDIGSWPSLELKLPKDDKTKQDK